MKHNKKREIAKKMRKAEEPSNGRRNVPPTKPTSYVNPKE